MGLHDDLLSVYSGVIETHVDDQRGIILFGGPSLQTHAAKSYEKVQNATAVIWKRQQLAEQRRVHELDALEKLMHIYLQFGFHQRDEQTET
jgi:hypothetical protein